VTIGGLNQVKVFRTDNFEQVATIPVGKLPHGLWPSGDGTRIYVGLENDDALAVIDTSTNKVVSTIPIGQAPQALTYVPNAVPEGDGMQNLQPLGLAGQVSHLALMPAAADKAGAAAAPTSVALFDQGLVQILQASVTGLQPKQPYAIALSEHADGSGPLESLANFTTNPAGGAVVNSIGQVRQIVAPANAGTDSKRRYLVIAPVVSGRLGTPVHIQTPRPDQSRQHQTTPGRQGVVFLSASASISGLGSPSLVAISPFGASGINGRISAYTTVVAMTQ